MHKTQEIRKINCNTRNLVTHFIDEPQRLNDPLRYKKITQLRNHAQMHFL